MNDMRRDFDLLDSFAKPNVFPRCVRAALDLDGALLPHGTSVELALGWPGCEELIPHEPSRLELLGAKVRYETVRIDRR